MEESQAKTPLKGRPTDEKTAVAGGIAVAVVIILFIGWAILFFKKVQHGVVTPSFDSNIQDQFNFESVRKAQEQLSEGYKAVTDEFRTIREQSGAALEMPLQEIMPQESDVDVFGAQEE